MARALSETEKQWATSLRGSMSPSFHAQKHRRARTKKAANHAGDRGVQRLLNLPLPRKSPARTLSPILTLGSNRPSAGARKSRCTV
jgi:hypothetical protein